MLATGAQATVPKHKSHCDINVLQPAFSAVVCNHCLLSCGIQRSPDPLVRSFVHVHDSSDRSLPPQTNHVCYVQGKRCIPFFS